MRRLIQVLVSLAIVIGIVYGLFFFMMGGASSFVIDKHTQDVTAIALSKTETAVATADTGVATAQARISATQTAIATAQAGNTSATATANAKLALVQGEYAVTKQSSPPHVKEGQTFQISFTLQNIGKNAWSDQKGYQLQCIDSDTSAIPCGSSAVSWCNAIVQPHQFCDVTVTMQAPTHSGKYKAFWQLQHNKQSVAPLGKPFMFVFIIVD